MENVKDKLYEEAGKQNRSVNNLLEQIIGAVKDGHTDGELLRTADALEIDSQRHVKYSKRRHPIGLAEAVDRVVENLGQLKADPSAYRADGRAGS